MGTIFHIYVVKQNTCLCTETQNELQNLLNSGSLWGVYNEVNGRFFGNGTERLFLPAAGSRGGSNGMLGGVGVSGSYWSRTAHPLSFSSWNVYMSPNYYEFRNGGYSVRCVAE